VTGAAIHVDSTDSLGRCVWVPSVRGLSIGFVLVLMVTYMLGRSAAFVLAIACHCSPTELHRQKNEQKNEEPATH